MDYDKLSAVLDKHADDVNMFAMETHTNRLRHVTKKIGETWMNLVVSLKMWMTMCGIPEPANLTKLYIEHGHAIEEIGECIQDIGRDGEALGVHLDGLMDDLREAIFDD